MMKNKWACIELINPSAQGPMSAWSVTVTYPNNTVISLLENGGVKIT